MPEDMGETARRIADEQRIKTEYAHLFEEVWRTASIEANHLRSEVKRLYDDLAKAKQELRFKLLELDELRSERGRRRTASGSTAKKRNRVVYLVTANVIDAQLMMETLWKERHPGSGVSMLVTAAETNGRTLRFVVEYTVKGGHPVDVERMLNKTAARIGTEVVEVECEQMSREIVEEDEAAA